MHTSSARTHALSASVALVMLAGCSGGSPQTDPTGLGPGPSAASSSVTTRVVQARQLARMLGLRHAAARPFVKTRSFVNPDAVGKALIFASDSLGSAHHSVVDIYLQKGKNKMVGQITGLYGPRGMATDKADNVYIESEGDSEVFVYAPPYTGAPALTLDDSGWFPYDVAVSSKGVVAVANICNAPSCGGNGSVTFYAKGATTPCATVGDPNFTSVYDDGFDDKGNLYVDGSGPGPSYGPIAGEIKGGCHATTITLLTTANVINFPVGIKVDKADRIAILDAGNFALYTYNPPTNGSFGSPVSTVPLPGFNLVYGFTFQASGRDVYVGASTSSGYRVAKFSYPAGVPKKAFNAGGGDGVAVTPPLTP
jgi:hypothetical protein